MVDSENRLAARTVGIAHRVPGFAYIQEGLSEGDELVVSRLRNPLVGTKVKRAGAEADSKPKASEGGGDTK